MSIMPIALPSPGLHRAGDTGGGRIPGRCGDAAGMRDHCDDGAPARSSCGCTSGSTRQRRGAATDR
jgi:hypothetical protein